jgi:Cu(I)/Ag(I) efflux system membrane protein CusA/SilA
MPSPEEVVGPPLIRSEDGQLVGFVFVDIASSDIDGYVRAAANASANR